ncbi:hypothetical protein ABIC16_003145 [Sphingomonas sp. PvP055]|uniref:hypothetical protein n=1 Tax=Sphingomonas sp. PvP055 TaxID=3156391 RepID=UPI003391DB44
MIRAAGIFPSFRGFVALCEKKGLITQRRKGAKRVCAAAGGARAGEGFVELRSGFPAEGYGPSFSLLLASLRLCVIKPFLTVPA